MFQWTKLGRVFDPTKIEGRPWMKEFAQAPATLVFDSFVRVFFSCRPERDEHGQYVSYTAYVDLDRKNLFHILAIADRPIMDLGGVGEFDEFGTYPTSVIRDGDKVLAYYGGWTRCESVPYNVSIGLALSEDGGRRFNRLGPGPVLGHSLDEPMTVSGPKVRKINGIYYMWYVAGSKWSISNGRPESIFKIRMAISSDGLRWTRINRDLIQTVLEEDECQASPDVIFLGDKFHMFFCYKFGSDFRGTDRGYRIGHAFSTDLLHWHREDSMAGIGPSGDNSWDGQSMAYPHVFELDGRVYMLYLGNEVGRFGFGLAVLQN
jgi:predicted GH43/DUF377 family glycosyl hydrolase